MQSIMIKNWDFIKTPENIGVIVLPPIPRPIAVKLEGQNIEIVTQGFGIILEESSELIAIVSQSHAIIIAESDERIVRETMILK